MTGQHRDPPTCVRTCREEFLQTVSADYNETFRSVCSILTAKGPNPNLWPLYWCDSTYCGVWIDQNGKGGQDRESTIGFSDIPSSGTNVISFTANVNLIINECNK
jgi:hypothetical protein